MSNALINFNELDKCVTGCFRPVNYERGHVMSRSLSNSSQSLSTERASSPCTALHEKQSFLSRRNRTYMMALAPLTDWCKRFLCAEFIGAHK